MLFQLVSESWQLHLRRVGVEAQPDLVRSIPKDGTGGSPSKENDEKKDHDDQPKDNGGNNESTSEERQLPPAPESSESHGLEDQPFINAKNCSIGYEDAIILMHSVFLKKQHTVASRILQSTWELFIFSLLPYYVESLYITSNNVWKFRQLV